MPHLKKSLLALAIFTNYPSFAPTPTEVERVRRTEISHAQQPAAMAAEMQFVDRGKVYSLLSRIRKSIRSLKSLRKIIKGLCKKDPNCLCSKITITLSRGLVDLEELHKVMVSYDQRKITVAQYDFASKIHEEISKNTQVGYIQSSKVASPDLEVLEELCACDSEKKACPVNYRKILDMARKKAIQRLVMDQESDDTTDTSTDTDAADLDSSV